MGRRFRSTLRLTVLMCSFWLRLRRTQQVQSLPRMELLRYACWALLILLAVAVVGNVRLPLRESGEQLSDCLLLAATSPAGAIAREARDKWPEKDNHVPRENSDSPCYVVVR